VKISIKCFSSLAAVDQCDFKDSTTYELDEGRTVNDLIQKAGIPREEVKVVFVNNRKAGLDAALSDGDRVGLAPAVGGM
jgi:molybdopterin converting factor small subunit